MKHTKHVSHLIPTAKGKDIVTALEDNIALDRQKNNDKIREYNRKYRQINKIRILKWHRAYRQKNKDKLRKYDREYRQKNKNKIREYNRVYLREYRKERKRK